MYKKYPVFKKPADENVKIWHYMDFTKFVWMIDRRAFHFTRIDQLEDKFEGSLSEHLFNLNAEKLNQKRPRQIDALKKHLSTLYQAQRKETVVNCWHINEYESAAMWKLYLKSEEGVAIQSTYKKLAGSFNQYKENDVCIGVINYIDYEREVIPRDNTYFPYIYKRKSFEHERELRAVITKTKPQQFNDLNTKSSNIEFSQTGLEVKINLEDMIEKVYVSPTAEKWFEDLVRSIMQKYKLNKKVIKSSLADDPIL